MFAYCGNNPVNRVDSNEDFWNKITDTIGNLINLVISYIEGQKAAAEEKYNEDTVNINGSNPEGIIDVSINGDNVKIINSH